MIPTGIHSRTLSAISEPCPRAAFSKTSPASALAAATEQLQGVAGVAVEGLPQPELNGVYLPAGEWTHLWSGEIHTGPESLRVEAPLQQPPVFYRADDPEAMNAVEALRSADLGVHEE